MPRYAMVTDLRKCVGCEACTVACNAEWSVPAGFARTHVRQTPIAGTFPNLTSGFHVAQCNQCDRPPAPTRAPLELPPREPTASSGSTRICASAAPSASPLARTMRATSTRPRRRQVRFLSAPDRTRRAAGVCGHVHLPRQVLRRP